MYIYIKFYSSNPLKALSAGKLRQSILKSLRSRKQFRSRYTKCVCILIYRSIWKVRRKYYFLTKHLTDENI